MVHQFLFLLLVFWSSLDVCCVAREIRSSSLSKMELMRRAPGKLDADYQVSGRPMRAEQQPNVGSDSMSVAVGATGALLDLGEEILRSPGSTPALSGAPGLGSQQSFIAGLHSQIISSMTSTSATGLDSEHDRAAASQSQPPASLENVNYMPVASQTLVSGLAAMTGKPDALVMDILGLALSAVLGIGSLVVYIQTFLAERAAVGEGSSSSSGVAEAGSADTSSLTAREGEDTDDGATPADSWQWRSVKLGSIACMNVYLLTFTVVSLEVPMMERLGLDLMQWNYLMGLRFLPAVGTSLAIPRLQAWIGTPKVMKLAAIGTLVGGLLQALAVALSNFPLLMVSNLIQEAGLGIVTAIIPAISSRIMRGEEQSITLAIVNIVGTTGILAPLIIMPTLMDYFSLVQIMTIMGTLCGVNGLLAAFFFGLACEGRLPDESLGIESEEESSANDARRAFLRDLRVMGIMLSIISIGTVCTVVRTNVTGKMQHIFNLSLRRVGEVQGAGILTALICAFFMPMVMDRMGGRPFVFIFAMGNMVVSLELLRHKVSAMAMSVCWGIGFGLFFNAAYSTVGLLVPGDMISTIVSQISAYSYIGFSVAPILYAYFSQYHHAGTLFLELLLAITLTCSLGISYYDMFHCGGPMFGTMKYDEREEMLSRG